MRSSQLLSDGFSPHFAAATDSFILVLTPLSPSIFALPLAARTGLPQEFRQVHRKLSTVKGNRVSTSDDHELCPIRKISRKMLKPHTNSSLYAVSHNSVSNSSTDSHTQSATARRSLAAFSYARGGDEQNEILGSCPRPLLGDPAIVARVKEPV